MDWSSRGHHCCDGSRGMWTHRGWRKGKVQWEELSVIPCLWLDTIFHVTKHPAGPKGPSDTTCSLVPPSDGHLVAFLSTAGLRKPLRAVFACRTYPTHKGMEKEKW